MWLNLAYFFYVIGVKICKVRLLIDLKKECLLLIKKFPGIAKNKEYTSLRMGKLISL